VSATRLSGSVRLADDATVRSCTGDGSGLTSSQ
jgi:hypothetical protein